MDPEGLSFGSEVGALKRVAGRDFGVNRDAVQTFLALRFTPSPETLFEGISRLPPGSAIRLRLRHGQAD
jgi:asparagine synthase (glutamine-hydrolysing)